LQGGKLIKQTEVEWMNLKLPEKSGDLKQGEIVRWSPQEYLSKENNFLRSIKSPVRIEDKAYYPLFAPTRSYQGADAPLNHWDKANNINGLQRLWQGLLTIIYFWFRFEKHNES
jgi:hypothetical protein